MRTAAAPGFGCERDRRNKGVRQKRFALLSLELQATGDAEKRGPISKRKAIMAYQVAI
jgi:hypothetical protein